MLQWSVFKPGFRYSSFAVVQQVVDPPGVGSDPGSGPAVSVAGGASPVAQLVRCPPRQDREGILTVRLVGAEG